MTSYAVHGHGVRDSGASPRIVKRENHFVGEYLFVENAPPGMCPWGEANCDDLCGNRSGCKLKDRGVDYQQGALYLGSDFGPKED
jgi:hypothetical protein